MHIFNFIIIFNFKVIETGKKIAQTLSRQELFNTFKNVFR